MPKMPKMEIAMKRFKIENRRYLGSKAKLLKFIHDVVNDKCGELKSFADLFAGTGNVGWSFNNENTKIIVNDLLESNHLSYLAWFGHEKVRDDLLCQIIANYNSTNPTTENYFSKNFAETYFSKTNCIKIGYIRDDIEDKFVKKEINERERAILITSLIYAMDHIANTVGHYDAFRRKGDLSKRLILEPLELPDNSINLGNEIYREDANELVKRINADIVYIDPPYNSRQYCDAYHLLENVALWQKADVYGVARKMERPKEEKSKYCMQKAPLVFDDLIQNIQAKYILVSYNNMGTKGAGRSQAKISDNDIISSLKKKGKVEVFSTDFNQFTTGKTHVENHQERLFVCTVGEFGKTKNRLTLKEPAFAKSPLNYTGGKFRLLPQISKYFDETKTKFLDVFGGGFNVGANVSQSHVYYNDKQDEVRRLIQLIYTDGYEKIKKGIEEIINKYGLSDTMRNGYTFYGCESNSGVGSYNKPRYERLRNDYNSSKKSKTKDYLLLTLILYSFNNQIRFNHNGEFNMPVGKRDFNNSSRKNLKNFCAKLSNKTVDFSSKTFLQLEEEIDCDTFVYCDPPYFLGTASYNENDGWTEQDESDLLAFLKRLNDKGVKFALSNLIEHHGRKNQKLIDWVQENCFNTIYVKSNYANSNYHIKDKDNRSVEVLIIN